MQAQTKKVDLHGIALLPLFRCWYNYRFEFPEELFVRIPWNWITKARRTREQLAELTASRGD